MSVEKKQEVLIDKLTKANEVQAEFIEVLEGRIAKLLEICDLKNSTLKLYKEMVDNLPG